MTRPDSVLDCALVIPVWNDQTGLTRLLTQAQSLFSQVIVIDDASDPPIEAPGVTLLRQPASLGPGAARNRGLTQVTAPYVLFFDADDELTVELPDLLADLAGQTFDLCLFQHADTRALAEGRWGQPHWDQALWEKAGAAFGALQEAPPAARPILAQTTNYPWNKIARSAFLRAHDIRCADTRVHQDIALHWRALMCADRVLTSDRICALHHVADGGGRLTNRSGPERLQIFQAFDPAVAEAQGRGADWKAALAGYAMVLTDWAAGVIDADLCRELRAGERAWLAQHIAPWAPEIAALDPDTAASLKARLA